ELLFFVLFTSGKKPKLALTAGSIAKLVWGGYFIYKAYKTVPATSFVFGDILLNFAVPFAWLVMLPRLASQDQTYPRVVLGMVSVFVTLLIYPVAGTQRLWSTFLLLPSAVV